MKTKKLILVNLSQKGVRSFRALTRRPEYRLAKRTAKACYWYRNALLWAVLLVLFPVDQLHCWILNCLKITEKI